MPKSNSFSAQNYKISRVLQIKDEYLRHVYGVLLDQEAVPATITAKSKIEPLIKAIHRNYACGDEIFSHYDLKMLFKSKHKKDFIDLIATMHDADNIRKNSQSFVIYNNVFAAANERAKFLDNPVIKLFNQVIRHKENDPYKGASDLILELNKSKKFAALTKVGQQEKMLSIKAMAVKEGFAKAIQLVNCDLVAITGRTIIVEFVRDGEMKSRYDTVPVVTKKVKDESVVVPVVEAMPETAPVVAPVSPKTNVVTVSMFATPVKQTEDLQVVSEKTTPTIAAR